MTTKQWAGTLFHFERATVDGRIVSGGAIPWIEPGNTVLLGAGLPIIDNAEHGMTVALIERLRRDRDGTVTGSGPYLGRAEPGARLAIGIDLRIARGAVSGQQMRIDEARFVGAHITENPAWPDTFILIEEAAS